MTCTLGKDAELVSLTAREDAIVCNDGEETADKVGALKAVVVVDVSNVVRLADRGLMSSEECRLLAAIKGL